MRWSNYFLPTGREVPSDAAAASHRLMVRAGLVRQLAAGTYIYLPLGLRALQKVEQIIRQEMDAAGAAELLMPALQPVELWEESGRLAAMGSALMRVVDQPWRKGTVLGPTHEEVVTDIARSYIQSYKQLPVNLYQIQTKFRDEQRPKSGVLRTREFIMKDAYSFDADADGLARTYDRMYRAYCRIFARCGLPYLAVEAESGPIGGDASHEFMVPTEAGEDIAVRCPGCNYAANLERAAVAPLPEEPPTEPVPDMEQVHTPQQRTIDEVCAFLKRTPQQMIKTLIYRTAEGQVVVALVRGDHEVNANKLARVIGSAGVELADVETIRQVTGADVGFAGPQGLAGKMTDGAHPTHKDPPEGETTNMAGGVQPVGGEIVRVVADHAVAVVHDAATGANRTDYHVVHLEPGRDFPLDDVADIRNAVPGDSCARCDATLRFETCIEVGHVFKLGTKYSAAMGANYLDEQGASRPLVMGCYGIGVNRVVAAAIEANHDAKGLSWPMTIAPFQVLLLNLDPKDESIVAACDKIYEKLVGLGVEALYDDRSLRAGPKFIDADLVGIPLRIAVGRKSFAEGRAELKWRDSEAVELLPLEAAAEVAGQRVRAKLAELNDVQERR